MSRFAFVQEFLSKVKPHYKFVFGTYDYAKNLDSYFIKNEHVVYYSRPGEGPNERLNLDDLDDHEIAMKIVWMVESANSWYDMIIIGNSMNIYGHSGVRSMENGIQIKK
jgi:hypothetical protein